MTPLGLACKNGSLEIVKYLIEKGANLFHFAWHSNILDLAMESRNQEVIGLIRSLYIEKFSDMFK